MDPMLILLIGLCLALLLLGEGTKWMCAKGETFNDYDKSHMDMGPFGLSKGVVVHQQSSRVDPLPTTSVKPNSAYTHDIGCANDISNHARTA